MQLHPGVSVYSGAGAESGRLGLMGTHVVACPRRQAGGTSSPRACPPEALWAGERKRNVCVHPGAAVADDVRGRGRRSACRHVFRGPSCATLETATASCGRCGHGEIRGCSVQADQLVSFRWFFDIAVDAGCFAG